jgi:uncharacterized damage-inducible protein DinB
MVQDERYPIGQLDLPETITKGQIEQWIEEIKMLPQRLRFVLESSNERDLTSTYRDGGWTVNQLVHHLADSHMNSFIRFKLGLTEDIPTVKPYDENAWAELPDAHLPIEVSLNIIGGVHYRWSVLLESMTEEQWMRTFNHPENGLTRLDHCLAHYAWHSNHHLAHIKTALNKAKLTS